MPSRSQSRTLPDMRRLVEEVGDVAMRVREPDARLAADADRLDALFAGRRASGRCRRVPPRARSRSAGCPYRRTTARFESSVKICRRRADVQRGSGRKPTRRSAASSVDPRCRARRAAGRTRGQLLDAARSLTPSRWKKRRMAPRAGGTAKAMPTARATAAAATTAMRSHGVAAPISEPRLDGRRQVRARPGGRSYAASALRSRSSSVIELLPQLGAQPLERPRQPRLDRAAADAERGRRLLLGELEEVAAGERFAVVVAEPARAPRAAPRSARPSDRRLGGRGRVPRGRVRRGAERERLRGGRPSGGGSCASLATIRSSQGRNGAPARKRPSAR